jgi:hypothetical protein
MRRWILSASQGTIQEFLDRRAQILYTNFYVKLDYYLARLPIATKQIVAGTTMMPSTSQSKHPRPTESKEEAAFSAPA